MEEQWWMVIYEVPLHFVGLSSEIIWAFIVWRVLSDCSQRLRPSVCLGFRFLLVKADILGDSSLKCVYSLFRFFFSTGTMTIISELWCKPWHHSGIMLSSISKLYHIMIARMSSMSFCLSMMFVKYTKLSILHNIVDYRNSLNIILNTFWHYVSLSSVHRILPWCPSRLSVDIQHLRGSSNWN